MNPHENSRLNQREKEEPSLRQDTGQNAQSSTTLEFAGPDEMLRHDSSRIELPPGLVERLQESVRKEPTAPRSWWRRLFGNT